jgi:hypothetical protein
MVDADTTKTEGLNRLITFELDDDETLLVRAGRDEMDNRTIYRGCAGGRYAIVPVSELEASAHQAGNDELEFDIEGLQLVGESVMVPEEGAFWVGLHSGGRQVVRMDKPGAYGLLWIPGE